MRDVPSPRSNLPYENPSKPERKLGEDVGARVNKMPRNTALLYRNKTPRDSAAPHYRGLTKLHNDDVYWVGLWVRSFRGEPVLEIALRLKTKEGQ